MLPGPEIKKKVKYNNEERKRRSGTVGISEAVAGEEKTEVQEDECFQKDLAKEEKKH